MNYSIANIKDTKVDSSLATTIKQKLYEKLYEEQKRTTIVIFIVGPSGVGKSSLMLKLMYEFEKFAREKEGKEFKFNLDEQIVYVPSEYASKIRKWIESDYYTFGIDEARFLVSAKTWQSFVNRVITEVNATIRQLKKEHSGNCGIIFLNSQAFFDVDKSLRRTVKYIIFLKEHGDHTIASFYETKYSIFEDEIWWKKVAIDLEDAVISARFAATLIEDRELLRNFHMKIVEAKSKILEQKFKSLEHAIKSELGQSFNKEVLKNEEIFQMIKNMATFSEKKGVYFSKEKQQIIMKMFNLTRKEFKEVFMPAFLEELKERNLV